MCGSESKYTLVSTGRVVEPPWKAGVQEQWGVLAICTPLWLTSYMAKERQM